MIENRYYCSVHRINKYYNMEDFYSVKHCKTAAQEKQGQCKKKDGVLTKFKDLNAFVDDKIQYALKKKKIPKLRPAPLLST